MKQTRGERKSVFVKPKNKRLRTAGLGFEDSERGEGILRGRAVWTKRETKESHTEVYGYERGERKAQTQVSGRVHGKETRVELVGKCKVKGFTNNSHLTGGPEGRKIAPRRGTMDRI